MKALTGHSEATTQASREQCLSLLVAVDRYPSWHPDVVKSVDVLERDGQGQPTKAQTKLHVHYGPITHDFDLTMAVEVDPAGTVKLRRIPHHGRDGERFDVNWRVDGGGPTRLLLDLAADLDVPRFLPLGGIGDSMANGFVSAATKALTS
ncbi:MAG TPA: SRPBCC family protein [Solirubrobacteraceae bacterium]|nr:SRPBCC family protein [Solirubrobacteraceae bacterium]